MQKEHRGRFYRKELNCLPNFGLKIYKFTDFLNCRLNFEFPPGYGNMNSDEKKNIWKDQLQILLNQKQKIHFLFPDQLNQEDVELAIKILPQIDINQQLDWQYESLFLGNKKQLLIYVKCQEMQEYLEKYKLPKTYQKEYKTIQAIANTIDEKIKSRNMAISLFQNEKIKKLTNQIEQERKKMENTFIKKYGKLMKDIIEHFLVIKKRIKIQLNQVHYLVYERLKQLNDQFDITIRPRYDDEKDGQVLSLQIKKGKYNVDQFEGQGYNDGKQSQGDEYQSSEQSSLQQYQLKLLQETKGVTHGSSPLPIADIVFEKYSEKNLYLSVYLKNIGKEKNYPSRIQYGQGQAYDNKFLLDKQNKPTKVQIKVRIKKPQYFGYYFRTANQTSVSAGFKFQMNLNLDQNLEKKKNCELLMLGNCPHLMPEGKHKPQGQFEKCQLSVMDFSLSQTHVEICDIAGANADWGLMKNSQDQIVESNEYYNVVNKMSYQPPALRLDQQKQIIKVSAGKNYGLMLSAKGRVWTFGINYMGQMGISDSQVQTQEEISYFREKEIFIVEIKATNYGVSFAIDSKGNLFRWGMNQFDRSEIPIKDSFGQIINYTLPSNNCPLPQPTPLPLRKKYDKQIFVQVAAGNQFFFSLNQQGTLYGWGMCRNLGKGEIKDTKDQEIQFILNPIQILENVLKVYAGSNHTLVIKKDFSIWGWGDLENISNQKKGFSKLPVQMTEQLGKYNQGDVIQCGPNYTCLYKSSSRQLHIYGQKHKYKNSYQLRHQVKKIQCEFSLIGILVQKETKIQTKKQNVT